MRPACSLLPFRQAEGGTITLKARSLDQAVLNLHTVLTTSVSLDIEADGEQQVAQTESTKLVYLGTREGCTLQTTGGIFLAAQGKDRPCRRVALGTLSEHYRGDRIGNV